MKIFIITHKKVSLKELKPYKLLLVGSSNNKDNIYKEYLKDNCGDNISNKNENYCELTGLYWIWKNINEDVVGLVHYRRFFYRYWKKLTKNRIITENEISNDLKKYDIILPFKSYFTESIESQYYYNHYKKDLDSVEKIINDFYPEYVDAYKKVMSQNTCYAFNMFIAKKDLIDDYCNWLFDILSKLENKIDISDYDDYQKRIYGFIAERLFNVWIEKKKLKVKTYPVFNNEEKNLNTSKINTYFRYFISYIKFRIRKKKQ